MKKLIILGVTILIYITFGFFYAGYTPSMTGQTCTEMDCICPDESDQEISCNTCYSSAYIFKTGILNVLKTNKAQEIITCKDGRWEGSRLEATDESYLEFYFFKF